MPVQSTTHDIIYGREKINYGKYSHQRMPGCCGIQIVYGVGFRTWNPDFNEDAAYKVFARDITALFASERVAKILMADHINHEGTSIEDFCMNYLPEHTNLVVSFGDITINPKTLRGIQVYEITKG